mmetsp:Transcript_12256/g.27802  ORF Transcript_12256/g.27802 Transcript_12256/m.27802 type:complete len:432 (+) Transcript_12256:1271-2566(+)
MTECTHVKGPSEDVVLGAVSVSGPCDGPIDGSFDISSKSAEPSGDKSSDIENWLDTACDSHKAMLSKVGATEEGPLDTSMDSASDGLLTATSGKAALCSSTKNGVLTCPLSMCSKLSVSMPLANPREGPFDTSSEMGSSTTGELSKSKAGQVNTSSEMGSFNVGVLSKFMDGPLDTSSELGSSRFMDGPLDTSSEMGLSAAGALSKSSAGHVKTSSETSMLCKLTEAPLDTASEIGSSKVGTLSKLKEGPLDTGSETRSCEEGMLCNFMEGQVKLFSKTCVLSSLMEGPLDAASEPSSSHGGLMNELEEGPLDTIFAISTALETSEGLDPAEGKSPDAPDEEPPGILLAGAPATGTSSTSCQSSRRRTTVSSPNLLWCEPSIGAQEDVWMMMFGLNLMVAWRLPSAGSVSETSMDSNPQTLQSSVSHRDRL